MKLDTPEQRAAYLQRCEEERRIKKLEESLKRQKTKHSNKFFDEHRTKTNVFTSRLKEVQQRIIGKTILVVLFFLLNCKFLSGGTSIDLAWNHDMDRVTCFRIYFGANSGDRDAFVKVGLEEISVTELAVTSSLTLAEFSDKQVYYTLKNLDVGDYYSFVTALNEDEGIESEGSNIINIRVVKIRVKKGTDISHLQSTDAVMYFTEVDEPRMFYSIEFEE